MIVITYIISGLAKEKASLNLGGGLSQCCISCPNHELSREMIIQNFYARLSLDNRNLLDTSCVGSYILKTIDFKWDLLERIKCNSED